MAKTVIREYSSKSRKTEARAKRGAIRRDALREAADSMDRLLGLPVGTTWDMDNDPENVADRNFAAAQEGN
jgi:hypothetical protein